MAGSNSPPGHRAWLSWGSLLFQTCKTDDKVQPSVTVGTWQQKRELAQLGPAWESVLALGFVRLFEALLP